MSHSYRSGLDPQPDLQPAAAKQQVAVTKRVFEGGKIIRQITSPASWPQTPNSSLPSVFTSYFLLALSFLHQSSHPSSPFHSSHLLSCQARPPSFVSSSVPDLLLLFPPAHYCTSSALEFNLRVGEKPQSNEVYFPCASGKEPIESTGNGRQQQQNLEVIRLKKKNNNSYLSHLKTGHWSLVKLVRLQCLAVLN